ncbi:MAG: class I SAM-dependent methyltransferase [Bradyrhizobium sp.]|uniref:class I SAM-dependent methyltransferase n=1 Tax=Bradyrhizobium sp. TaxID=376 RepID=UPI0029A2F20C|nr:class I SAM-dependent methyltransferase [Bradyrhizobium sp.]MDX3967634.1 class I SAM-dependent methyltransferase [Bradyrhizobium sp.]
MQPVHYDELADLDLHYWWFRVRFNYASRLLLGAVAKPDLVVDLGCGTGGFLHHLTQFAGLLPSQVLGIEPDERAASVASRRGLPIRQMAPDDIALAQIPQPADVICLLDVLEHIEDAPAALQQIRKLVRPGGYIVILVPALTALWSEWDVRLGHKRRYSRATLEAQLIEGGWEPIRSRYLFSAMTIPGLVRAKLINSNSLSATEFPRVSPLLNRVLTRIFEIETRFPSLPFGTSVAALARNN